MGRPSPVFALYDGNLANYLRNGRGVHVIDFDDAAIPCPSAADPARSRHRPGTAWQIPTVQSILGNPVYTGHAAWSCTYAEHELADEDNLALGFAQHVRRAAPDQ
ncbi:recombinase family protein [Actinospica durhamensis]|uniref:recombinase family protein n=1 Tax=Actinospica durhamensis TaxID=1508375 RepID=UPI0027DCEEFB|nr:recombinase family protein [Actinospica durhamensis]